MDVTYWLNGTEFVWDKAKAAGNPVAHDGISFEEAATVFFDPLVTVVDVEQNGEARNGAIGFDAFARMLLAVHLLDYKDRIRIISAGLATKKERKTVAIPDALKARLTKDRAMTSITLRIPVDVVESLKSIAPKRGMGGYQSLLKSCLSDGLRRDEAQFVSVRKLGCWKQLRKRGIPQSVIDEASKDVELSRATELA